jgi:hypothetical protein
VKETPEQLVRLQELLDASHARSGEHLTGIINEDRTLRASEIAGLLTGMRVLAVSTVTAQCQPRISGVDGHFLNARWVFTSSGTSAKARHLRVRPATSVAYIDGEEMAVYCHGRVEFLTPEHTDFAAIEEHLTAHYGSSPSSWGPEIVYCRVQPTWMVGYAFQRSRVLAANGVPEESRP